MSKSSFTALALVAAAAWAIVVGLTPPAWAQSHGPPLSKELAYGTYVEKVGRVEIVVGGYLAALDEARDYIPFQYAIGVWGKGPELTVTLQNFQFHDSDGNVYEAATPEQVSKDGINQMIQAWTKQQPLNTGNHFDNSAVVMSNFYPTVSSAFTDVHLDRETYMRDVIYFPRPKAGLDGEVIFSFFTEGMEEGAVNVCFTLPEMKKKHKKKAEKIRKQQAAN